LNIFTHIIKIDRQRDITVGMIVMGLSIFHFLYAMMAEAIEPVPQASVSASTPRSTFLLYNIFLYYLYKVYIGSCWRKLPVPSYNFSPPLNVKLIKIFFLVQFFYIKNNMRCACIN